MNEEKIIGRVIIESSPIDANVSINGVYYGRTPLDLQHPVGSYTAKLEKEGYKTKAILIRVGIDFPPSNYWGTLEED